THPLPKALIATVGTGIDDAGGAVDLAFGVDQLPDPLLVALQVRGEELVDALDVRVPHALPVEPRGIARLGRSAPPLSWARWRRAPPRPPSRRASAPGRSSFS